MRRAAVVGLCAWICVAGGLGPGEALAQEEAQVDGDAADSDHVGLATQSGWYVEVYGYVRAGLEFVNDDPNFDFVGETNGFVLHNARLGTAGGHRDARFSWRLSIDGAADIRENTNVPDGELGVELRDAYIREELVPNYLGLQIGQFKAPFSAEELRSTADLRFVSRAVGLEGVRVGRGFEEPGIVVDRQLGLMLSPADPIRFGDFGVSYYLMLANGNGDNEILNDNSTFAYVGRLELYWSNLVRIGGAVLSNERTEGDLPNQFVEDDFGWSVDLLVAWAGLEIFGQLTSMTTEFVTSGSPEREQLAWHAQAIYMFDFEPLPPFGPAYRIASFDPRAEGGTDSGGISLEQYQLMYHTIGLNVGTRGFPVTTILNYTFTGEEAPRELENNRFEALVQLVF